VNAITAADAAAGSQAQMSALVKSALEDLLGSEAAGSIREGDPLMTAGLNSTAAVALTQRLESSLGVALPPTLVFDFPSIKEVSEYLAEQHAPQAREAAAAASVGVSVPATAGNNHLAAATAADANSAAAAASSAAGGGRAATSSLVMDTVRELLGLGSGGAAAAIGDGFDAATPLMVAGLNSTSAVTLTSRLESALGVPLPPTLVFDYPTVDDIVEYLAELELMPESRSRDTSAAAAAPAVVALVGRAGVPAGVSAASPAVAADAIMVVATAHRVAGGMLEKPLQGGRCEGIVLRACSRNYSRIAAAACKPLGELNSFAPHERSIIDHTITLS
jgi:acyl carrier protein